MFIVEFLLVSVVRTGVLSIILSSQFKLVLPSSVVGPISNYCSSTWTNNNVFHLYAALLFLV